KLFSAYPGEETRVFFLLIFGLTIGVFLYSFGLGATVLFLEHHGSKSLPEAFGLSGAVALILSVLYSYLNLRLPFAKLAALFIFILTAGFLYVFYDFEISNDPVSIRNAFVLIIPAGLILIMIFNSLFSSLFDISQVKRLSKKINFGIVGGGAAILFAAPWLQNYFSMELSLFMFIGGVAGLLSLMILGLTIVTFRGLNELQVSAQFVGFNNKYRKLFKDRYFVLLSAFVLLAAVTLTFVDFSFFSVVHVQYAEAEHNQIKMMRFLSFFTGSVLIASFMVQAFISKWSIQQYGMKASLLITPVMLFLVIGIAYGVGQYFGHTLESDTFFLFFIVVIATKAVAWALEMGLQEPVFKLYFLPISSSLRFDIQSKVEGAVKAFALLFGGVSLMLIAKIKAFEFLYYPFVIAGLIVMWVIVIYKISLMYRHLLKESLDKQQDMIKSNKGLSESYLEQLVESVYEQDHKKMSRYLSVLNILDPVIYKKTLIKLLDAEDSHIQEMALRQSADLCLLDAIPVLEKIMGSKYYPVLRTSELIKRVYTRLKAAEFRLEKIKYIEQLTLSKLPSERTFGALLTNYADDNMKGKLLNKLFRDPHVEVRYHAVTAAAGSDNLDLHNNLIEKLSSPAYSNAAVAAIAATGEQLFHMLETAFFLSGQKQKTQLRIVQIYGRVGSERAVELLIKKLNYPNQNVITEVLKALSKCGHTLDASKALQIRTELDNVCNTAIYNMSLLMDLKREGCSDLLKDAVLREIDTNYDNIFRLMALIYDPRSVELVKTNISSGNVEEAEFASDLLDVFLSDEMKPMLIPILSTSQYEEKVQQLRFKFPTEPITKHEVLVNLIQRDYKWVNRWTKACALRELAQMTEASDQGVFAANLVNPDSILRETAAEAIYEIYRENLDTYKDRFQDLKRYDTTTHTIEKVIAERNQDKGTSLMKFEIIAFLNDVPDFMKIPGLVLSEIAKVMTPMKFESGDSIDNYDSTAQMDYYVVYQGSVELLKNGDFYNKFEAGSFIHNLDWINKTRDFVELKAQSEVIILKIKRQNLNELMSFYDEIPASILYKAGDTTIKNQKELVTV
ncbi:hypothetical protein, partial [Fulvivirga aurantia]|uniref:hypothetical protein n=1 Tax=Fulvivirga aurantia TaxID=2529383 RepID=UPI00162AE154